MDDNIKIIKKKTKCLQKKKIIAYGIIIQSQFKSRLCGLIVFFAFFFLINLWQQFRVRKIFSCT